MLKSWKPILEDINSEIGRINASIADAQFNSDFPSKMHIIKMRVNELGQRLYATTEQMKSEAAAYREDINLMMAEYGSEAKITAQALSRLRIFRAERSRANYLHVMELKQNEKGGAL